MTEHLPLDPLPGHPPTGRLPVFASRYDQRLAYCLYVPERLGPGPAPLVVIQHGSERSAVIYRDRMAEFADQYGAVILAPLFPAGIGDRLDLHNYKFIDYRGIRFDHALLAMIDEVAEDYPVDTGRFYLHGFSGGGQFTHRFFYLHADRLAAISVGAPGRITQLDESLPWWNGTADLEERFGQRSSPQDMRRVPVLMIVGDQDVETWEINNPGGPNWLDGVEKTGDTRIARLRTLERNFLAHGIDVRFETVPGVAHRGGPMFPTVREFFGAHIESVRAGGRTP